MSIFSSYKKIFLLGFIIVILIAIPFSVYMAQQRQQTQSKADASTTLSFDPVSSTVKVGDILTLGIFLDPKTSVTESLPNQVSFVKLSISFDASKFTTVSDSLAPNLSPLNKLTFILEDAVYSPGKASISLSIGANPTEVVTTKTKIAILKLKGIATTTPTSPNITFDSTLNTDSAPNTQVLSIASSDKTSENVLSTTTPATVTVTSTTTGITSTLTPTPTGTGTSTGTGTGTSTVGGGSSSGLVPVCSSLEVNGLTSGTAPYPLTFTATGNDSDGTIRKISFNFGDSVEDLTGGGGIGTSSVSGQLLHTYKTPGIYTAYAILTDNNNNLSAQQTSCTKTITISSTDLGESLQSSPTIIVQQPLPPTGDGNIMFGLGTLGVIFTIIGGALLLL